MQSHADYSKTAFVYHPDYVLHNPGQGHPERPARVEAITSHLKQRGFLDLLLSVRAEPASEEWLLQIHTKTHLENLEDAVARAPIFLDADTGLSTESYRIAKLAAGGVLTAVDLIMDRRAVNAFVAARPPGHHALADRAMGFCLINHVAVGARYVQKKYGLERVLIVDWDVHHGNGTQDIFYTDPTVFYFSVHQSPYYPGTGSAAETGDGEGAGSILNVPIPAGASDADLVRAFEQHLVPAAERFRPQFIFISAGFDGHRDDPLAGWELTETGFRELTRIVKTIAARFAEQRIVSVLEGGYDLDALARSVEAHLRELASADAGG